MRATESTTRIEGIAKEKLTFLQDEYGFGPPYITHEDWSTTMSFLAKEIAVELEIDWRELDMFVLVTSLDDGRLPSGYYVSDDGRKCRFHLEDLLQKKLGISRSDIKRVLGTMPRRVDRNEGTLERRLDSYVSLIREHLSVILQTGADLFTKDPRRH